MPEPLRADYTGHLCRCVIVLPDGVQSRCSCWIDNPDQPVCDGCLQRHMRIHESEPLLRFEMART
jgi:hypothetical protein